MKKANLSNTKNILGWVLIVLVLISTVGITYYFKLTGPVKALAWLAWLILTLSSALLTRQGQKAWQFGKEAKSELQKVVWPTRQETVQTTAIVMAMAGITGLILWGIDAVMIWAIAKITHLG